MGWRDTGSQSSKRKESILSILVVDDDVGLCSAINEFFAEHGFDVEAVHDGASGLAIAVLGKHDLILLDVTLPVLGGCHVLRTLRKYATVPVILLSAKGASQDRMAGLEAGADDYVVKPLKLNELLARVWAVLKRKERNSRVTGGPVSVSDVVLNPRTREVRKANVPVVITSFEFDMLNILMRAAGRVVSRNELSAALYHRAARRLERTLDVHVSHLRRKLEAGDQTLIRTIRGT
ncbi:MAG TPA: response regulator transcription factor, partial [Bryobacteraceae bacterium]|nr:response regulator transcription factor [Bryobacteraceae bacterium]